MSGFSTAIYKFWTEYKPDPNDASKLVGHDYVAFGPPGMKDRQVCTEKVSRILAVYPRDPNDGMNKGLQEANDFADFIRPQYEAWKKGQEMPETGTPLAAWNAITTQMGDVLKARGIRTVEMIAELTESGMQLVPLPGMRSLRDQANLFLQSKDQTRAASELASANAKIADLTAQMAELMELVKANDKTGALEPLAAPKRRGRPPKVKEPGTEEQAA